MFLCLKTNPVLLLTTSLLRFGCALGKSSSTLDSCSLAQTFLCQKQKMNSMSKQINWNKIIKIALAVLTALAGAIGVASCRGHL